MLWVGQTLLLSVVCLGHAAENVLLGSPEGRMYLVPRDVVTGAVKERPPWDVCLHSFGSLMPFVSWALTRNEFRVNGAMATFWPAGGQPRWGELIDSLGDRDRHFRCGTCRSDRTVSENRFRRLVAEKGLLLSCHVIGEQCSVVKRSAPRTASVGEPFNSQRATTAAETERLLEERFGDSGRLRETPTLRPEVVPAPTIERFGGGRDIRAWIQEVRRVGRPLRLSDLEMVAYAVSGMKKRAQQDWQALVYCASAEITTLEEVEATLLRQFDVPKTQLEEWEEWGSL